jgi:osmoprotectant transport system ATP-binding protein
LIEFADVTKVFRDSQGNAVTAVDHLNLTVEDGETLCLIGTSGCGKTTTMKLVNRLVEPTSGRVRLDGNDVRDLEIIPLRRRIGYVIQSGGLFPHMTAARNVGLLGEVEGWDAHDIERRVRELLELVNLPPEEFAHRYPRDLSGGQRQRVGVARALALDPPYILMDEPFGALDPISRDQIQEEFMQLKARVRKTIIFVTHDMGEAFKLADRIALMDRGRLLQVGREEDFRRRPANAFVAEFLGRHLDEGGARA